MNAMLLVMAQDNGESKGGGLIAFLAGGMGSLLALAVAVVMIAAVWKIFSKAGEPGWAALIPIYNLVVLLKIIGKPLWWILLFLVPCVNFVALILLALELAKCFGKGVGFAVGMIILPIIFYPMLAFGSAEYRRPA